MHLFIDELNVQLYTAILARTLIIIVPEWLLRFSFSITLAWNSFRVRLVCLFNSFNSKLLDSASTVMTSAQTIDYLFQNAKAFFIVIYKPHQHLENVLNQQEATSFITKHSGNLEHRG